MKPSDDQRMAALPLGSKTTLHDLNQAVSLKDPSVAELGLLSLYDSSQTGLHLCDLRGPTQSQFSETECTLRGQAPCRPSSWTV